MNNYLLIVGLSLSTLPTSPNNEVDKDDYNTYRSVPIYCNEISNPSLAKEDEYSNGADSYCTNKTYTSEQSDLDILYDENYIQNDIAKQNILARLNTLRLLDEDWDGYGAPRISIVAIDKCRTIINQLPLDVIPNVKILPSEFGGVQMEIEKDNGIVNCDFGDETFSYYVERKNKKTEYYSFLNFTEQNFEKLIDYFCEINNEQ